LGRGAGEKHPGQFPHHRTPRIPWTAPELSPCALVEGLGILEVAAHDGAETVRRLRQFGKGASTDATDSVDSA
jgi:hypothetical protein